MYRTGSWPYIITHRFRVGQVNVVPTEQVDSSHIELRLLHLDLVQPGSRELVVYLAIAQFQEGTVRKPDRTVMLRVVINRLRTQPGEACVRSLRCPVVPGNMLGYGDIAYQWSVQIGIQNGSIVASSLEIGSDSPSLSTPAPD